MVLFEPMKKLEKLITKKIIKAIHRYNLISPGDRILLGISGGKDSMTLAKILNTLQKHYEIPFTLQGIHIHADFTDYAEKSGMYQLLDQWEVPYVTKEIGVVSRLKEGRKMNCYWCSTQRRVELLRYAEEHNYNTIVLGHHLDDILETLLMNMTYRTEISTMTPKMQYDKYPQMVIRPLALVPEQEIIDYTKALGISSMVCTCNYDQKSHRRDMREALQSITGGDPRKKERIFHSMENIIPEYLPKPVR